MRAPNAEEFEAEFERLYHRSVRPTRDVPCDLPRSFDLRGLTDFERRVLLKTSEIPSGEVQNVQLGGVGDRESKGSAGRGVGAGEKSDTGVYSVPSRRAK